MTKPRDFIAARVAAFGVIAIGLVGFLTALNPLIPDVIVAAVMTMLSGSAMWFATVQLRRAQETLHEIQQQTAEVTRISKEISAMSATMREQAQEVIVLVQEIRSDEALH